MLAGVELRGTVQPEHQAILSSPALAFVAHLHRMSEETRQALLQARAERKSWTRNGHSLDFAAETSAIRDGVWRVAPPPADLADRQAELVGPCTAAFLRAGLASGANSLVACLEDAIVPGWGNVLDAQAGLYEAVRQRPSATALFVQPRGWHLPETHLRVDGVEVAGAVVDFGLYCFHNAQQLHVNGSGAYFDLPKLEHYLEARLWNNLFVLAESILGLPLGSIRASASIETLPAAFLAEEILYELRDHSAGLRYGHRNYLFDYVKHFSQDPNRLLPDYDQLTVSFPLAIEAQRHLIRSCRRRGAQALSSPAHSTDEEKAAAALGFDGISLLQPEQVATFAKKMVQLMADTLPLASVPAETAAALAAPPQGTPTALGLAQNIHASIRYLAAWLGGTATIWVGGRMETGADLELRRAQLWQWRRHGVVLDDGTVVTAKLLNREIKSQLGRWQPDADAVTTGGYREAATILLDLLLEPELPDFFTLPCYRQFLGQ